MAVNETVSDYSTTASSNTPGGGTTIGPDLDNHLRDIKKNIRALAELYQGISTTENYLGRLWLDTSGTASSVLTVKISDGTDDIPLFDIDTSANQSSPYIGGSPSSNTFAAGTQMLFYQTAAPTSWTQVTAGISDHAIRVTSGSGGGGGGNTGFTSVFGSGKTTGAHALTTAELPVHTHGAGSFVTDETGNHTHTVPAVPTASGSANTNVRSTDTASTGTVESSSAGSHDHAVTGTSGSTGSSASHTHTLSLDLTYITVIVASKD